MMSGAAIFAGVIALLVFVAVARMVQPASNQSGPNFNGPVSALAEPERLRIGTYNVQTGKNLKGQRNIHAAAEVLQDLHLAAVQEVYGAGWLNKLGIGQAQTIALAEPGGFAYLFAATRYRWFREQRGNATLSKLPVAHWRIEMLPDQSRKSPRNMTVVELNWKGQPLVFINTHLHTGRGREQQLKTVLEEFKRHDRVVLAGDFNTQRDDPILSDFLLANPTADALEQVGIGSESERIDWLLSKGVKVVDGTMQPKGISDHPYFEIEIE